MVKQARHKSIILTVVITFVIITVAFVTVTVGREIIINTESYAAEKKLEKMSSDILNKYEYHTAKKAYIMSCFNDNNESSILCALTTVEEGDEILEMHINFGQIDIQEPISSITSKLSKLFETDVETFIIEFCDDNDIDYEEDPIIDMGGELFFELIDELQSMTGVQL